MGRGSEMSSIPKGYKKTDVGVIPDDWEVKILGEEGVFLTTSSYTRSELKEYGDVACIHYGDIHTRFHTWLDCASTALPMISRDMVKQYPYLKNGDLVIADASEDYEGLGDCVEICNIDSRLCIGGLHTIVYRAKPGLFAPSYIGLLRNLEVVRNQFVSQAVGTKVYSLTNSMIGSILVPIPSLLSEQKAIAEALSDMNALIEAQKELIAKKRDIKQGTMHDLLSGHVRLPGYETKGWKHTDIGNIPDDWVVRELGDICDKIIGGGTPSRNNKIYWNGKIPWATVKDLSSFNFNSTQEYITEKGLRESSSTLIPAGTIILATRMLIGKPVIYNCNVAINQDLKALFLIKDYDKYYLSYYLNMKSNELISVSSGSTVLGLSIQDLKTINLIFPFLLSEQQAIAETLSDMDNELETLEAELEKLHHMKRGMMQELLTGRIRLI